MPLLDAVAASEAAIETAKPVAEASVGLDRDDDSVGSVTAIDAVSSEGEAISSPAEALELSQASSDETPRTELQSGTQVVEHVPSEEVVGVANPQTGSIDGEEDRAGNIALASSEPTSAEPSLAGNTPQEPGPEVLLPEDSSMPLFQPRGVEAHADDADDRANDEAIRRKLMAIGQPKAEPPGSILENLPERQGVAPSEMQDADGRESDKKAAAFALDVTDVVLRTEAAPSPRRTRTEERSTIFAQGKVGRRQVQVVTVKRSQEPPLLQRVPRSGAPEGERPPQQLPAHGAAWGRRTPEDALIQREDRAVARANETASRAGPEPQGATPRERIANEPLVRIAVQIVAMMQGGDAKPGAVTRLKELFRDLRRTVADLEVRVQSVRSLEQGAF